MGIGLREFETVEFFFCACMILRATDRVHIYEVCHFFIHRILMDMKNTSGCENFIMVAKCEQVIIGNDR